MPGEADTMTLKKLSITELPALTQQGFEADLDQVVQQLLARNWMLTTAESCTGGLVAAACTDRAGSSQWFDRGLVTYANSAKTDLLNVPTTLLTQHGAVSEPVARAMAEGVVCHSPACVGLAVTGVAGPSGGSADKPVGTVCLAWHVAGHTLSETCHFPGDRQAVRQATVRHALGRLAQLLGRV